MTSKKGCEFAVDGEDMWVSPPHFSSNNALHSGLKDLEHSLRCLICREFMTAPVSIVPCQHAFCSECIRKHFTQGMRSLKRQAFCPVCLDQVKDTPPHFNKSLQSNRSMELVILKFQALRANLKGALQQNSSNENATSTMNDASNVAAAPGDNSETSRLRRSKRTNYAEDDNNDDEAIPEPPAEAAVAVGDTATAAPVQRKKMVLPQYSRLKKKQLREICAKEGLSTSGSDDELKKRHEGFVSLYNSECDSFHPRSHAELVKVITSREQECKKEATKSRYNGSGNHAQCMEQLKQSRKMIGEQQDTVSSTASSGDEAFDTEMKNNFAKLIEQARQGIKKKQAASNRDDDKSSGGDDTEQPGSMDRDDESKENSTSGDNVQPDVEQASFTESKVAAEDTSLPKCIAEAQAAMAQKSGGNCEKDMPAVGEQSAGAELSELPDSVPPVASMHASGETDKTTSASAIASSHATHDTTKRKGTLNVVRTSKKKAKVAPIARERRTSAGGSIIGPWTCPLCTFYNTSRTDSKAKCAMCGTLRQSGTSGSGDDYIEIDC